MTSSASTASGGKGGLLIPAAIGIGLAILVLTIAVGNMAMRGGNKPPSGESVLSGESSSVVPVAQAQQPTGVVCLPFSVAGATCEVGTEGSAWIRPDSSSSTLNAAKYCWDNKPDEFTKIEYLIGGKTHTFDPSGPEPQGAVAYRFFPKEPTTLSYNLAEECRP
ncbi:MAG: hypothetical protein QG636_596 [Patescibacteria group bacterium]|nr:hypothetical protein [Patescibacteria group bacterium]